MVVAILGTISSMGAGIYIQVVRWFRQNQARVDIQRDARTVFDLMGRNIRQARASTIVIDNAPSQPPYSRIKFTKIDDRVITYYQEGGKLYEVTVGSRALTENLRYLGFNFPQTDDDSLIAVSVTMEKATYDLKTKALQLSVEKMRLRND